MAIIYTYPKLTNPQGNELIVVSDVNNRNATRLITIASIASLIPSGGGCANAIAGIVDGVGNPLYTPPACSDMELISSDTSVTITSTGTGIDLAVNPAVSINCATKDELGGILAEPVEQEIPEPAESGSYYPVQIVSEGCTAVVRVPDPSAAGCEDVIKTLTPSSGEAITASGCDTNVTLSVAADTNMTITGAGTTLTWSLGCATEEKRGGIFASTVEEITPTTSETGTYYRVQVNDLCEGMVRVPDGGGSGGGQRGFSPLEIYSGETEVADGRVLIQAVCDTDMTIDAVDYFVTSGTDAPVIGIYNGTLSPLTGTLLYSGQNAVQSNTGRINTHNFTTPLSLIAGQKIVIYISFQEDTLLLGKILSSFTNDNHMAIGDSTYNNAPETSLSDEADAVGIEESDNRRVCLHFYEKP